jgi:hypothetical protein
LQKPLDSEGENFLRGRFYLAKGKAFETGGEFPKILEILFEIILLYHWLFAKEFEKTFQKKICKNNLSGANVVQNVKLEESNHTYLEILSIGLNSSNFCTSIKIANYLHSYTLYLLWSMLASITKKGEIEREMGLIISYNRFWCLTSITNHMD